MAYELFVMCVTGARGAVPAPNYIPPHCVSTNVKPENAGCWNELSGVCSVEQTGEPMGWRPLERGEGVWQVRSGGLELVASKGSTRDGDEDWWVTVRRGNEAVVEDHRVRVGPESELGEALAAVVTTAKRLEP